MNQTICRILESYREEMLENLQKLIRIRSVATEPWEEAPFGKGIQEALDFVMDLGRQKGFKVTNFDNYACEISSGVGSGSVGVVTHLDVVPEGEGWQEDPYGGSIVDEKIFGRGAVDDKGPLIAAFYAHLAIKESGLPLSRRIKHIVGTNEEGGVFPCLSHYKAYGEVPECGIVPDAWFPAVFAEKGFLNYRFNKRITDCGENGLRLVSLSGGEAMNIVPAAAKAVFSYEGKELTLTAQGKAAHASAPELGINAVSLLISALKEITFAPRDLCETLHGLAGLVARDSDGAGLGVRFEDETGALTNNLGMISYEDGTLSLKMNLRSPIGFPVEELKSKLAKAAKEAGMEFETISYNPPLYLDKESPLMRTLIQVYQDETGDLSSQPVAHGGGSYARALTNFVPFGPSIQGEPLCFHKQDEHIRCDRLMLLCRLYAEAVYRLAIAPGIV